MDSSQFPSLNDERRISTMEALGAPPPDAAAQPAPVNPTMLAPSAKSFELMRQLEALSHEVAVVSRRCIKVQEGSNSAGLHTVEPSIRVSPRDQLASYTPSFGRRTSLTLANFFIAALIGVAVAFVWQSQRVSTAKSSNDVTVAEKQSGFTPVGQVSLQDAPPQLAPVTQTAPASTVPATSPELVQQLEGMARDLAVLRRSLEELAARQEHLVDAQDQLAARQEQMAQKIAKPQAVEQDITQESSPSRSGPVSPPPRKKARRVEPRKLAAQSSSVPPPAFRPQ